MMTENQQKAYRLVAMQDAGCRMHCPVEITVYPSREYEGQFLMQIEHKDDGPSHYLTVGPFPAHQGIDPWVLGEVVRLAADFGVHTRKAA